MEQAINIGTDGAAHQKGKILQKTHNLAWTIVASRIIDRTGLWIE
jgi:hypothetical protein